MTARSLRSPYRPTARPSPPAAISARGIGDKPPYGDVRLFDFATGRIKAVLPGNDYAVYGVAFSPDGTRLAAAGQDGYVYLWRADAAEPSGWTAETPARRRFRPRAEGRLCRRRHAACRDHDRQRHPALGPGYRARRSRLPKRPRRCATSASWRSPFRRTARASPPAARDGTVQVWNAADGTLAATMPPLDFFVGSLSFAGRRPARRILRLSLRHREPDASPGRSATRRRPRTIHAGHDGTVFASAASPDGDAGRDRRRHAQRDPHLGCRHRRTR